MYVEKRGGECERKRQRIQHSAWHEIGAQSVIIHAVIFFIIAVIIVIVQPPAYALYRSKSSSDLQSLLS